MTADEFLSSAPSAPAVLNQRPSADAFLGIPPIAKSRTIGMSADEFLSGGSAQPRSSLFDQTTPDLYKPYNIDVGVGAPQESGLQEWEALGNEALGENVFNPDATAKQRVADLILSPLHVASLPFKLVPHQVTDTAENIATDAANIPFIGMGMEPPFRPGESILPKFNEDSAQNHDPLALKTTYNRLADMITPGNVAIGGALHGTARAVEPLKAKLQGEPNATQPIGFGREFSQQREGINGSGTPAETSVGDQLQNPAATPQPENALGKEGQAQIPTAGASRNPGGPVTALPPELQAESNSVQQKMAPEVAKVKARQAALEAAKTETQPELVGMGGAAQSEFSRPTIGDLINPELRDKISAMPGGTTQPESVSALSKIKDYISGVTEGAPEAIKGWLGTISGKSLPKTTLKDRALGETGARYAASRTAAGPMADVFATDVLTGTGVDQHKFDAALKADNLLSIRDEFGKSEDPAKQAMAGDVNTLIGTKNFPFKSEAELQNYFKQPEVAEAVKRHVDNWNAAVEPMFKEAAGIDPNTELPSRGKYSGARVNLNPIIEGEYKPGDGPIVGANPGGTLTGTFRRKSPFARQAKGTGQQYVLNYHETMANTFAKQLEIANKRRFDDQLVKTENAVISEPGKSVKLPDGEATKAFPLIRKGFENKNIYVRQSLAKEYAHAADVVLNPYRGSVAVGFNKALAQSALAGLTDATVHIENLGTVLFQVPGSTGTPLLIDSLLSGAGRLDIPVTLARMGLKSIGEFGKSEMLQRPKIKEDGKNPAIDAAMAQVDSSSQKVQQYLPEKIIDSVNRALLKNTTQMASLAEMNATRTPHSNRMQGMKQLGQTVQGMDRITRMTLDDAYRNLVKEGLVKDTETNRREFVNQAGNYNLRTQGEWIRFLRQTWLSPFVTAGRNFASLGVKAATLNPGVEASSIKAAAALRAGMASKWIGTAVLVSTLNYLITGKLSGRKGTPFGAVDTGKNDENGQPLSFNVAAFTGQSRALRTVGARGAIEAYRNGLKPADIGGAAVRDVGNTALGALAGPGVKAAMIGLTGYSPAISVGRESAVVAPGESQVLENLRTAAMQANPITSSIEEARKPGGSTAKALERQLPRFTLAAGKPAQKMDRYPQIVEMAQANDFIEGMIHTARTIPMAQRQAFVEAQIKRLPPESWQKAVTEIKRRRVFEQ